MKTRSSQRTKISVRKKLLFSLLAVGLFFGSVELVLRVTGIGAASERDDPFVGFAGYAPLFVETEGPDGKPVMKTADGKLTWFNPQSFPKSKPAGTRRIFCLGGSTTYGRPYDDSTSFCGWLREFLPAADGTSNWEVINAGGISYASYRVARVMDELVRYEPDLFIVYTGHNEFLERRTYSRMAQTPESLRSVAGLLSQSRTFSVMQSWWGDGRTAEDAEARYLLPAEVTARLDSAVGLEAYERDDELTDQIVAHYRLNLERMIRLARRHGAEVVFVTPASNLADFSPFKSEHRAGISAQQAGQCDRLIQQARDSLAAADATEALRLIEEALSVDDRFALAHYWHGRCLLSKNRVEDARSAFVRARDEDVCPLRALSSMRSVLLETARTHGVPLVDFKALIDRWSAPGLPGGKWFLDHVHPTVEGHRRLALAILQSLEGLQIVHPDSDWNEAAVEAITERVESRIDPAAQGRALVNLSKTLGWAGRKQEADALALQAIELLPDDPPALYQAGNAFYDRGQLDRAEQVYRRVLEVDPKFTPAHYGLGIVGIESGNPPVAIEHFRRAIELDPDFAEAHYNLGTVLLNLGEAAQAEQHFRTTVRLQPENHYAYNTLGAIAANSGELETAEQWFRKALEVDPNFPDAHANLAHLYHKRGNDELAKHHCRSALEVNPGHPAARALLDRLEN